MQAQEQAGVLLHRGPGGGGHQRRKGYRCKVSCLD